MSAEIEADFRKKDDVKVEWQMMKNEIYFPTIYA
jgi:hypothetical protein